MPNFANTLNPFLTILRAPIIRRLFLLVCLLSQLFLSSSNLSAQGGEEFKFNALDREEIERNKEEILKEQEILREKMKVQQEILREEMERIRIETQKIMKEIAMAMKE